MTFKIDTETFQIEGRKGDSGAFKFIFDRNLSEFDVYFMVKANVNDKDERALIKKIFSKPDSQEITVNILPKDTSNFRLNYSQKRQFTDYFWGLKVAKDNVFAQTVIPLGNVTPPKFRIYPEIVGGKINEQ